MQEIQDEKSLAILQKAKELQRENDALKETLAQIRVINTDSDVSEGMYSDEEEILKR